MSKYIKSFELALDKVFCDKLIRKFEDDDNVMADPQPEYSLRSYLYASDYPEWASLMKQAETITNKLTSKYFKSIGALVDEWFNDGFVVARYQKGDTCVYHDDSQCTEEPNNSLRYATVLFYLNTVDKGETYFPNQKLKIKPQAGKAVIFPAMLTHPHKVLAPKSNRYILQTWITDPYISCYREE